MSSKICLQLNHHSLSLHLYTDLRMPKFIKTSADKIITRAFYLFKVYYFNDHKLSR